MRSGGLFLLFRAALFQRGLAARPASRLPRTTVIGRSTSMQTTGRRHGSRSGCFGSGLVARAAGPEPMPVNPGMSHSRVPGPVAACPWGMRARDWRGRKHNEPVLACDCDLRFSFP